MWAAPTAEVSLPADTEKCLGCHSQAGGAKSITPTVHPPVALQNVELNAVPASLPLFDQQGKPDANGQITCRTCHIPHGRTFDSNPLEQLGAELPIRELTARRPMIRPYAAPNLCSTCHGLDGLRLYLYYHDPLKRRPKTQLLSGAEP